DEDLFIVDRGTGRIVADPRATYSRAGVNLRAYEVGVTNSLNDRIYLGTRSGLLLGLREIGQVRPRPLRDVKSRPFGYIPPEGIPEAPAAVTPPAEPKPEAAPGDQPTPAP